MEDLDEYGVPKIELVIKFDEGKKESVPEFLRGLADRFEFDGIPNLGFDIERCGIEAKISDH